MGNTTDVIKMNGFKKNSNVLLNSIPLPIQSNFPNCGTTSPPSNQYATTLASTSLNSSTFSKRGNPPSLCGTLITTASSIPWSFSPAWPFFQTRR